MPSGNSLWDELLIKYFDGVTYVRQMERTWNGLKGLVDEQRFTQVKQLLAQQEREARW